MGGRVAVVILLLACAGADPGPKPAESVWTDTAGTDTASTDTAGTDTGPASPATVTPPQPSGITDADHDGWPAQFDCDDADPNTHPGAIDWCDAVDQDCDGNPVGPGMCGVENDLYAVAATAWWVGEEPYSMEFPVAWRTSDGDWLVSESEGYEEDGRAYGGRAIAASTGGTGAVEGGNLQIWSYPPSVRGNLTVPVGDFDGDGYDDLALGGGDQEGTQQGRVTLLSGDVSTWTPGATWEDNALAWWEQHTGGDDFGEEIHAGDLTGDGLADLLVHAPLPGRDNAPEGWLYILPGRTTNLPDGATVDAEIYFDQNDDDPISAYLTTFDVIADADGDGFDDVIGGAYTLGFASGAELAASSGAYLPDLFTFGDSYDFHAYPGFGGAAGFGDFDGDGIGDYATVSTYYDEDVSCFTIAGGADLGRLAKASAIAEACTEITLSRGTPAARHDLDGDGFPDPVIERLYLPSGSNQGVMAVPTSRLPLGGRVDLDEVGLVYATNDEEDYPIQSALSADLDHDGIAELHIADSTYRGEGDYDGAVLTVTQFVIPWGDASRW